MELQIKQIVAAIYLLLVIQDDHFLGSTVLILLRKRGTSALTLLLSKTKLAVSLVPHVISEDMHEVSALPQYLPPTWSLSGGNEFL